MQGTAADRAQRQALDPSASVWVSASAGTGKTKVLTERLLTLMLDGTEPARILCLTFTRAAAAEMANRLNDRLAKWTTMVGRLAQELVNPTAPPAEDRTRRQLFARVPILQARRSRRSRVSASRCSAAFARSRGATGIYRRRRPQCRRDAGDAAASTSPRARRHPAAVGDAWRWSRAI